MRPSRVGLAAFLLCLVARGAAAQADEPDQTATRLEELSRRAAELKIVYSESPQADGPKLSSSPIMRCNDATREEEDGAIWLWLDGKRPVAALCLIHKRMRWNYELVSLTDEALEVTGRPTWQWKPEAALRPWTALDDPVPESPRAKQLAFRAIARKFEGSELRRGETFPLRLVDRPVYLYSDAERGVIEGALFAMSYGTNPELLIQIEARRTDAKPQWHVAFARLSAAAVKVRQGDKELWKVDELLVESDYDPNQPYYAIGERPAAK